MVLKWNWNGSKVDIYYFLCDILTSNQETDVYTNESEQ